MSKARKTAIILMGISSGFTVLYEMQYILNYYMTALSSVPLSSLNAFRSYMTMILSLGMTIVMFMNVQMVFTVFAAVFHKKALNKGFGLALMSLAMANYTYQVITSGVTIGQLSSHSVGVTTLILPVLTIVCNAALLALCVFGLIAVIRRKKLTVIFIIFAGVGILFTTAGFLFMIRYLILGSIYVIMLQLTRTVSELTYFCAFAALALEPAPNGTQTTPAAVFNS